MSKSKTPQEVLEKHVKINALDKKQIDGIIKAMKEYHKLQNKDKMCTYCAHNINEGLNG